MPNCMSSDEFEIQHVVCSLGTLTSTEDREQQFSGLAREMPFILCLNREL